MTEPILESAAHRAAAERLRAAGGSSYKAFDDLGVGLTHQQVHVYLENSATFMALGETDRSKVAGLVMAFAMVAVEADRRCTAAEQAMKGRQERGC